MNSSAERKAEALAILREALAQVQPQKRVSRGAGGLAAGCALFALGDRQSCLDNGGGGAGNLGRWSAGRSGDHEAWTQPGTASAR